MVSVLSHMNPILPTLFRKTHFNIILSSTPGLLYGLANYRVYMNCLPYKCFNYGFHHSFSPVRVLVKETDYSASFSLFFQLVLVARIMPSKRPGWLLTNIYIPTIYDRFTVSLDAGEFS